MDEHSFAMSSIGAEIVYKTLIIFDQSAPKFHRYNIFIERKATGDHNLF